MMPLEASAIFHRLANRSLAVTKLIVVKKISESSGCLKSLHTKMQRDGPTNSARAIEEQSGK